MASSEDRERHSKRRKKKIYAKILHDQNEYKGAYSLKILKDKTNYKREKLNPREVEVEKDEDE